MAGCISLTSPRLARPKQASSPSSLWSLPLRSGRGKGRQNMWPRSASLAAGVAADNQGNLYVVEFIAGGRITRLAK